MSARQTPPFRAEHVGSLLRPADLAAARDKARTGDLPLSELVPIEDENVRAAVALQEDIGLGAVTDGEYRRGYWHLDFMVGFDGVELSDETYGMAFSAGNTVATTKVTGNVSRPETGVMTSHFEFLNSVANSPAKFCIPSATMYHFRSGREGVSEDVYPDYDEFWNDITAAYRDEIKGLADIGLTYLQIDDVNYCYFCDPKQTERLIARGDDPDQLLDKYIEVNNQTLRDRPEGLHVTTHMCRGNFQSAWMAEGGYESVAEKMLNGVEVDGFFMEYDSDRAGDFEPLRFLPEGKVVVLGLISTKVPELEDKDDVKRRIDEAAKFAPLEQLCLSPQCGFASTHHGNKVTEDDQRRKLELVVEVADEVWG